MLSRALTILAYVATALGAALFIIAYEMFALEDRLRRRLRVAWKRSKAFTYVRSFTKK